ncbi:MAG: hypothetical protein V1799_12355 [bacterium]
MKRKNSLVVQSQEAIDGMSFTPFEFFARYSIRNPKAFVTSSETILISHRKYGHVYNFVKLRIFEDDPVEITARYLTPPSLQAVMVETFHGKISHGNDHQAFSLFQK